MPLIGHHSSSMLRRGGSNTEADFIIIPNQKFRNEGSNICGDVLKVPKFALPHEGSLDFLRQKQD